MSLFNRSSMSVLSRLKKKDSINLNGVEISKLNEKFFCITGFGDLLLPYCLKGKCSCNFLHIASNRTNYFQPTWKFQKMLRKKCTNSIAMIRAMYFRFTQTINNYYTINLRGKLSSTFEGMEWLQNSTYKCYARISYTT